jgi:tRNA threonylcarbamoyladenosine biosynthesis protein TsaE
MSCTLATHSAESTRLVGEALGCTAVPPLAFLLTGDYGSGKTTFVQGLARGLGISGPVRSPSYNILKRYTGRYPLVHADLYRTHNAAEIDELGLEEMLGGDGILAVEWPGGLQPASLDLPCVRIGFSHLPGGNAEQRVLALAWDESCHHEIKAVLHALATR